MSDILIERMANHLAYMADQRDKAVERLARLEAAVSEFLNEDGDPSRTDFENILCKAGFAIARNATLDLE